MCVLCGFSFIRARYKYIEVSVIARGKRLVDTMFLTVNLKEHEYFFHIFCRLKCNRLSAHQHWILQTIEPKSSFAMLACMNLYVSVRSLILLRDQT